MRNEPSLDAAHQPTQSAFKGLGRPVLVSAVFFMAVTGLAYPLATTGVANLIFLTRLKAVSSFGTARLSAPARLDSISQVRGISTLDQA